MARDFFREASAERAEVLALPEVSDFRRALQSNVLKAQGYRIGGLTAVEETDCHATVRQGLGPNFEWTFLSDSTALCSFYILIDGDHFLIREDAECFWSHF